MGHLYHNSSHPLKDHKKMWQKEYKRQKSRSNTVSSGNSGTTVFMTTEQLLLPA